MAKESTLHHVATFAGVSIATASRCFSNPEVVHRETLERVLKAALALNYRTPQVIQQERKLFRVAVFGELFTSLENVERLSGIANALRIWPHELITISTEGGNSELENLKKLIITNRIDGLILIDQDLPAQFLNFLQSRNFPTVSIEKNLEGISQIFTSPESIANMVSDYISKKKWKRAVFIGFTPIMNNVYAGKLIQNFREKLSANGIKLKELLFNGKISILNSFLDDLYSSHEVPDVILTSSDKFAVAIQDWMTNKFEVSSKNRSKVEIIGIGNLASFSEFSFSTVSTHLAASGRRAVEILQIIRTKPQIVLEEVPVELVSRGK